MIQDTIKVHDRFQFEIKLGYPLQKGQNTTTYDVETFFFLPKSIDINKYTYKKSAFYKDVQNYIRFKTPAVKLGHIIKGNDSPFHRLEGSLAHHKNESPWHTECEYQLKLFSCIVRSALRDHVGAMRKKRLDPKIGIPEYIHCATEICTKYRALNCPKSLGEIHTFGDEYISMLVEHYAHKLISVLEEQNYSKKEIKKLRTFVVEENNYRAKKGFPSTPQIESSNEEVIYRQSILKKYMNNVLFLNTETKQEGVLIEQVLFSIAAGIAMIFATGIAFASQQKYGNFTGPFFFALVVGYMFKDRIKDFFRIYFKGKLQRWLFDYKSLIYSNPEHLIGIAKETAGFIRERQIEPKISTIRNKDLITEIANEGHEEAILKYHKKITIFRDNFKDIYKNYHITALNDIMRFNITPFLRKMDNPNKTLHVCNEKSCRKVTGHRVYHVNMVIKYSAHEGEKFKHYRLILNRDGIVRIEKVDLE